MIVSGCSRLQKSLQGGFAAGRKNRWKAGLQTSAILQTSTTASLRRRGRTFMGLDEVRLRGRGHEPGDRRPISFMLPRRFLGRPARRSFRGRLLRVPHPHPLHRLRERGGAGSWFDLVVMIGTSFVGDVSRPQSGPGSGGPATATGEVVSPSPAPGALRRVVGGRLVNAFCGPSSLYRARRSSRRHRVSHSSR